MAAVCAVLASSIQIDNPAIRLLAMGTPFHLTAWLLVLLIPNYRRLAIAVFVLHCVVVAGYLVWVFSSTDGTERWVRASVLVYMDFPIMVLFAVFDPPPPVQIGIWFTLGSAMWSAVAVLVAHAWDTLMRGPRPAPN